MLKDLRGKRKKAKRRILGVTPDSLLREVLLV